MPSLHELVRAHTDLVEDDVAWLQLLMADWQILADLSFADLVLWLPDREGRGYWAGGQMRPTTGPTALVDDVLGTFIPTGRRRMLDEAFTTGRLVREGDPEWRDDVPVRVEVIPVRRAGRVIATIGRNTNLLGVRTPSRLELSYLQTAADLTQMIAAGHFPLSDQRSDHADSPRVGDGFVRLDPAGRVVYASPNGLSAYRRLGLQGDLAGLVLTDLTRELVPARRRPDEETLSAVLGGRDGRATEVGTDEVTLIVRSIPLRPQGERSGALLLVRDVTELRSRDRELVTKDVTIREIHHRVKNNLQTVAALLRLQARRTDAEDAKAALEEAVRRVGSIAIVHETLSHAVEETVDFDEIADRLGSMVVDVSGVGGAGARRAGGLLRQAALGGGHAARDGADRAAAERRRARLRRPGGRDGGALGPRGGHRSPHRGSAARRGGGRRSRPARRLRPRLVDPAGPVDRAHAGGVRAGRRAGDRPREPWHAGAGGPAGRLTSGGADARAGVAALERATLVLAEATPHAVVLAGLEGPGKTLLAYLTATADLLGLLDLEDRGTGVADREEQLRVLVEACGAAAPIHGWGIPSFTSRRVAVYGRSAGPGRQKAQRPDLQPLNVHTTPSAGRVRHNYCCAVPVTPKADTPGPDPIAPPPLQVAAALVALEALVLVVLAVLELANLRSIRLTMGVTTTVFFLAAAAGLAWCAWSLWKTRRWARGPVVMAQLIQLGLAWNFRDAPTTLLAIGLAVAGVVVIAGLLHPATTQVLEEDAA